MKKTTKLFCLLLIATLVCGCKQEKWLDWKLQNELWLINNANQPGVKTTPTGLQYKCIYPGIEPGTGTRPDDAKIVVIDYTGWLINGYEFDKYKVDSIDEAEPFYVSAFVAGFAEGLKQMNQFGEYEFYIPYYLGYGEKGTGTEGSESFIPPYSTLIFRVYLHQVY